MKPLTQLTRPNILRLKPYSSARDEYKGKAATVFLDANESPYNSPLNRYPDPLQWQLKERIAPLKGVQPGQIFLGNGSDEAIDLLYRAFCEPREDNVVAIEPSYGMYKVCADVNDVAYRPVLLDERFQLSADRLLAATDEHTKLIFLCSPNNPTGNLMDRREVLSLLERFDGLVVVDEAYADFSGQPSFLHELSRYPGLVVLQTFSKAWGCAAMRLGMAFAQPDIIAIFNKIKYPYNVNLLTQRQALAMLDRHDEVMTWVSTIKQERAYLEQAFRSLPCTVKLFPTDANFFLVRVTDAVGLYNYLVERGIIVRNRHTVTLCGNCLRVTVGLREENDALLNALRQYTLLTH